MIARDILNFGLGLLNSPLIALTLVVVCWRLRAPRPSWSALLRQPGFVACVAAIAGFVVFLEANYFGANVRPAVAIGWAVATAWVLLVIGRRWGPERGWIDRLGRVAGVGWIAFALCEALGRTI